MGKLTRLDGEEGPASRDLRDRLMHLVRVSGMSYTAIATRASEIHGRPFAHNYFRRKVYRPATDPKPLDTDDVDLLLACIGRTWGDVLALEAGTYARHSAKDAAPVA